MAKFSKWFKGWQWLKCSGGEYNYSRVTGAILSLIVQPIVLTYVYLNKDIKEITNMWQYFVIAIPVMFSVFLFGFEIIRDNKAFSLRVGNKVYGFDKEEFDEDEDLEEEKIEVEHEKHVRPTHKKNNPRKN